MRSRSVLLAALCVGGMVVSGCTSDDDTDAAAATATPDDGWTVLVYSIADTNLEPYLLSDLTELADVGSQDGLAVEALVDRAEGYTDEPFLDVGDWVGAKELTIGQGSATELSDLGPVDTGDPAVLSAFITRGFSDNPNGHHALVISDHGGSWPGVGGDESADGDGLSLAEMNSAITDGLAGAGVDRLDLLGLDACLMATYETASTLQPVADRMIASQELEPGHGWDYHAFQTVADDPSADADTLGTALVDGFLAQAQEEGDDDQITLALLDLTKMPAVDDAVTAFAGALSDRAADIAPVVGRERDKVLGFGRDPDPEVDTHMADLGMLASEIGVDALDVSDQADTLVKAINDVVVHKVTGATMRGASGLSIYFPPQPELLSPDYAGVTSSAAWGNFLTSYYGAGDAIPEQEQPDFQGDEAAYSFDADGLTLTGTFDAAAAQNVASATIDYGLAADDGTVTFYGEEPATVSDDGSGDVSAVFDLTTMNISDGTDTMGAYLTLDYDDESGLGTADVPMAYVAPGAADGEYSDVTLSIVFDSDTGDVQNETYYIYDDETETYGELAADPEGLVFPKLYQVGPDGVGDWVVEDGPGIYANLPDLGYDFTPIPSGTPLYTRLYVEDFGGNSDTVSAMVQVP